MSKNDLNPIRRRLVVNADDLGISAGVNRGIIEGHENGIITSASLMVRWPAAVEAARLAAAHPKLGVGLHLDLGEWAIAGDEWVEKYHVVKFEDVAAVEAEVKRQVDRFFELMGRAPTHLDSHQHVHRDPPVLSIAQNVADRLGIVLRHFDPRVRYCGDFYGQDRHGLAYHEAITVEALVKIVRTLEAPVTEVACHAGYGADLDTMYRAERETELAALCDPRVRRAVEEEGIELINFGEIASS